MKVTTQKLLLALYTTTVQPLWLGYEVIEFLLPEITPAGQRSLIAQLKQKSLLSVERQEHAPTGRDKTMVRATQQGQQAVKAQFPAFSELRGWEGDWTAIHFLSAPSQDPNFRYLRGLLLQRKAIPLNRGHYLYPGTLPEDILRTCQNLYTKEVFIVKLGENILGDLQTLFYPTYALSDISQNYSGISKEIIGLLRKKQPFIDLNDQQKKSIYLVFDRFFTALVQDPGITHFYYPQSPDPLTLLADFQELLTAS